MSEQERPLALITGASAGIGREYALRLGREGYDLVIVGRRRDRLEEVASELRGVRVECVDADLGTAGGLGMTATIAAERRLDLLVNNAGVAHYMPFANLPDAKLRELIDVNVLALTVLTRAAVPGMVERKSGAIINVASLLAFSGMAPLPIPRAVYAATKSYVVTFTELVARELAGTGVRLQVVCPGVIRTEFHERQGIDMSGRPRMEPGEVVSASLAALETGELVCVPALEDRSILDEIERANGAILPAAQETELAAHYREPSPSAPG
jgi:short-subunit dehydrogenase